MGLLTNENASHYSDLMTFTTMRNEGPPGTCAAGDSTLAVASNVQATPPARISSRQILGGRREIEIEHEGTLYRLRVTQAGKLILTK
jgi:hemin uptake protein HemP